MVALSTSFVIVALTSAGNIAKAFNNDAFSRIYYSKTQPSQSYTLKQKPMIQNMIRQGQKNLILLESTSNNNQESTSASNKNKKKGIYSRPSAAIERGSGFFIPGLEGPRVRLLFGILVILLIAVNNIFSSSTPSTNSDVFVFSEIVAIIYSILLLLQAGIEFSKEDGKLLTTSNNSIESASVSSPMDTASSSTSDMLLAQRWSNSPTATNLSPVLQDAVQWSAASYISLTPATNMLLLDSECGVWYQLGSSIDNDDAAVTDAVKSAIDIISNSSSGRVSLPVSHPVVQSLFGSIEGGNTTRCVILQRIDENRCWMVISNQLLQSFTKQDLKWLKQLGVYVNNSNKKKE